MSKTIKIIFESPNSELGYVVDLEHRTFNTYSSNLDESESTESQPIKDKALFLQQIQIVLAAAFSEMAD